MNQREKDYQHARSMCLLPAPAYAFADGAEYGRQDLAKLERLLREGYIPCKTNDGRILIREARRPPSHGGISYSGATLAEALAQVVDP